jgi:hypothetical protein
VNRIAKLLALAAPDSGATPAERANARGRAEALMAAMPQDGMDGGFWYSFEGVA